MQIIKDNRNNSIDLLKIICMIGIILLHFVNNGGILNYKYNNILTNNIYLIISNILLICLNIFGIITGYLYIDKERINYKNITKIIIDTLFYSIIIVTIFYSYNLFNVRSLGFMYFINSLFPAMVGKYWYITCYILLFFMIPFSNFFINNIKKKNLKMLLIILFVMFCVISDVFAYDYFRIINGYSPFWLIYLYMIGAYIKKYGIGIDRKKEELIIVASIITNIIIVLFVKNALTINDLYYHLGEYYTSPFSLLSSVLIFDYLATTKIKDNVIYRLGKYSLVVYIIHCHSLIFDLIIKNNLIFVKSYNLIIELIILLFLAITVYFACVLIELIKQKIYNITRINILIEKVGKNLDKVLAWK